MYYDTMCAYARIRNTSYAATKKCRKVRFIPTHTEFTSNNLSNDEVIIYIEEIEAIRLSDLDGIDQNLAAELMSVSRGTFQRIINSARYKVADMLINGKNLKISGGHYEKICCQKKCMNCPKQCQHNKVVEQTE